MLLLKIQNNNKFCVDGNVQIQNKRILIYINDMQIIMSQSSLSLGDENGVQT
jgi:hypothetical protein